MPKSNTIQKDKVIVYFDGVCGLCNTFVDFLIEKDVNDRFRFAPLQSAQAQTRVPKHLLSESVLDSVVVEYKGRFLVKSEAALTALAELGPTYFWARLFKAVPKILANKVYDYIAQHRYAWFGRTEMCRLPGEAEKHKFLTD